MSSSIFTLNTIKTCADFAEGISRGIGIRKILVASVALFYEKAIVETENWLSQSMHFFSKESILSLNLNFDQYGKAAAYVYDALKKHPYLSGLTARVLWSLDDNIYEDKKSISLNLTSSNDAFYEDKEIREMLIVDKILNLSDAVEIKIIDCLLNDNTYEQIAEKCFLSVDGIKYRIKKIISSCGVTDKAQIIRLLKKYIE